jgi:hypothetical protein
LQPLRTELDVAKKFADAFLPAALPGCGVAAHDSTSVGARRRAASSMLQQLRAMREAMLASEFMRRHSFVGASLFFVVDVHGERTGVYLIDFAHVRPVPAAVSISHNDPWEPGNHEDGIFLGIDSMVRCWETVLEEVS